MKLYAIGDDHHAQLPAGADYRQAWPYREFFHGTSEPLINRYGERPYKTFQLIRNVRLMPPVLIASIHMVVSEQVAGGLRALKHIDLNPCVWEKVYDYPVDQQHIVDLYTRFSALSDDFGDWLEEQMHPPGPGLSGIKYFELVVPLLQNVADEFDCRTGLELPDFDEGDSPVMTCSELHERYPVISTPSYYVCTEPAYRILKPHVNDPAMFSLYTIEVDAAGVPAHAAVQELQPAGPLTSEPLSNIPDALGPQVIPPPDPRQAFLDRILTESAKLAGIAKQHPDVVECHDARVAVAQDADARRVWCEIQRVIEKIGDTGGVSLTKEQQAEFRAVLKQAEQNERVDRLWKARLRLNALVQEIYDAVRRQLDPPVVVPGDECRGGES